MARVTHVVTIDKVARQIGENLELVEFVSANSDNIDCGEKIWVDNGTEEGITTFTRELCLNLGDAHHQAARFSVSLVCSIPSVNLIPSMTFGN